MGKTPNKKCKTINNPINTKTIWTISPKGAGSGIRLMIQYTMPKTNRIIRRYIRASIIEGT